MTKTIDQHEGKKYLRWIHSADENPDAHIDVYSVLEAFNVTCPGRQQAIKKLLMAGQRGKGNELEDLLGAEAALSRAIELQEGREKEEATKPKKVCAAWLYGNICCVREEEHSGDHSSSRELPPIMEHVET